MTGWIYSNADRKGRWLEKAGAALCASVMVCSSWLISPPDALADAAVTQTVISSPNQVSRPLILSDSIPCSQPVSELATPKVVRHRRHVRRRAHVHHVVHRRSHLRRRLHHHPIHRHHASAVHKISSCELLHRGRILGPLLVGFNTLPPPAADIPPVADIPTTATPDTPLEFADLGGPDFLGGPFGPGGGIGGGGGGGGGGVITGGGGGGGGGGPGGGPTGPGPSGPIGPGPTPPPVTGPSGPTTVVPPPPPSGVSAVPEPSTWAMLLVGISLTGGMMRRRRTGVRQFLHKLGS